MTLLPHSAFTTDALPEKDRFAAWREDMSIIFDVERSPLEDTPHYNATFDLFHFGQSVLGDLKASPGRYVRMRRKVARDGLDAVLLQLFLEGGVQFGVGRRTTYAKAGDIVVFDLAQPVDNVNTKFRHLTVMWPRVAMEEVVPDIARWHGLTLPRNRPAVTLLRRHMTSCSEMAHHFSPIEGQRVEAATLSLVVAALAGTALDTADAAAKPATAEMLMYQVKRYIRNNLGSSDLSPGLIARQFGISRTQLYELLESVGGISRYQRRMRMQRCLADLQDPAEANKHISEIAYRWGFKHLGTFNRNFREAFGMPPREARTRALDCDPITAPITPHQREKERLKKEHHQWFKAIGI